MRYPEPPNDPGKLASTVMDVTRSIELFSAARWLTNATITGDLTIKDGGSISVEDADSVVKISKGSLLLRDGQIEGSALKDQIDLRASHESAEYTGYQYNAFTVGQSWTPILTYTTDMALPAWARKVIVRCSGSVSTVVTNTAPGLQVRLRGGSGWTSPRAHGGIAQEGDWVLIGDMTITSYLTSTINHSLVDTSFDVAKPYEITLEARMNGRTIPRHKDNDANLNFFLLFMR